MSLDAFHPLLADWFRARFETPTDPQAAAWPAILAGRDVLVAAPTGSGKTLAAFFACLDRLYRRRLAEGPLPDRTAILYVSPLKALGNDMRRNLEEPLAGISALARERGLPEPGIEVAVRSGDTKASERRALVKRPPHILVTTPESLFILLTSEAGRRSLGSVETVIVDEIHAVAGDKRGAHLALSLERLDRLVGQCGGPRPVRVGLSATQRPIEEVARLLTGRGAAAPGALAPCTIVDAGHRRDVDLRIEVPRDELAAVTTSAIWDDTLDRIAALSKAQRTTLVFVNTRRLVERVAHLLEKRLGEGVVGAHHGSLSREARHRTEERLKRGELSVVVATASLELGIDVGAVDLVCQVGSPRAIRTLLQRVGRSGHRRGALPVGRLFAITRDQIIECMALVRAVRAGELDRIRVRQAPLDILAQQVVAAVACEDLAEEELLWLARGAYPFASLSRETLDEVLDLLSEGVATRRGRSAAYVHRDRVHGRVRARRGARLVALTSGGAIPDAANLQLVLEPEGTVIGTVDEDFAVESLRGDVIQLGNAAWEILRVEGGRMHVADAAGRSPTIPFWKAEAPGRTDELSEAVSDLREEIAARLPAPDAAPADADATRARLVTWLAAACAVPESGARASVCYLEAARAALGCVPSARRVVAERFFDEAGGMQLVIHAPFGSRVNRAFGLALRKRFCRSFDFELQAAATDDGVLLSLGPQHSFPLELTFRLLKAGTAREVLSQAVLASPLFGTRWRWTAQRALSLPRSRGGKKVPANIQRFRAEDLLTAVFPAVIACPENHGGGDIEIPDHPLVRETLRDCFEEAMDLEGLERILAAIERGEVQAIARETPTPSPLCHEILNAYPYAFLDDAPLEERRSRAVSVRRGLPAEIERELAALDPEAISQVLAEARPEPRDADELHDVLHSCVALPEGLARAVSGALLVHAPALVAAGRATWLDGPQATRRLVAAERLPHARAIWPEARATPDLTVPRGVPASVERSEALAVLLRGWLAVLGPVTEAALAERLGLPAAGLGTALAALEGDGLLLRGRYSPGGAGEKWCDRGLLARIHRLTVGRLRSEVEAVPAATYLRFLATWQRAAPGTQLHGVEGVLHIVKQLQGFEAPAAAWEESILPARIAGYQPELLDAVCLSGTVAWGRLSTPGAAVEDALLEEDASPRRRAAPGRGATLALALREDLPWLAGEAPAEAGLSHAGQAVLRALRSRGATFVHDLPRASGRLRAEVDEALSELVGAGLVTADGFEALRSLVGRARRERMAARAKREGRGASPLRLGEGRWAVLPREPRDEGADEGPPPAERWARQLLERYGVLCRDVLGRERGAPPWRDLLPVLRRLEARGEIRGGRFVAGLSGEQFGLAEAAEALRAQRRAEERAEAASAPLPGAIEVAAGDPLNLVGHVTPGERVAATSGARVGLGPPAGLAPAPSEGPDSRLMMAGREG